MGCCSSNIQKSSHTLSSKEKVVVALFNYDSRDSKDISFAKGDRMVVLDDETAGDWWTVKHLTKDKNGQIPKNFVAEEGSLYAEDWFFEAISKRESEQLLLTCDLEEGAFIIWSHMPLCDRGKFSLSIKSFNDSRGFHVAHHDITPVEGGGYTISSEKSFKDLKELVAVYSQCAMGLNHVLTKPCPKVPPVPPITKNWEIDRKDIEKFDKLDDGYFTEVYLGKWKINTTVAVKTLRPETNVLKGSVLAEVNKMKNFRHSRVVALFGVCSKEAILEIVVEYMPNGNLLDYLRRDEGKKLGHEEMIYIAEQISSAMEYLGSEELVHRNLTARNVLIGESLIVKVADGSSFRANYKEFILPIRWAAPEVLASGMFTIKSDVWSYGILLAELFTYGQVPYPGIPSDEVVQRVKAGQRMDRPSNTPDEIFDLMTKCWEFEKEKRPNFEEIRDSFDNNFQLE